MATAIQQTGGQPYTVGAAANTLYPASGIVQLNTDGTSRKDWGVLITFQLFTPVGYGIGTCTRI